MTESNFAMFDLSHRGENSSQLACFAPCFSHRCHISAVVPQGEHIPAGTDGGWPACMFECGLRKIYQHQITTCKGLAHVRPAYLRHSEQYHLHQLEIRLSNGVLAVRLPETRMHFDRLGVSTLFVNDKGRGLLGRINCGSCSIDAR